MATVEFDDHHTDFIIPDDRTDKDKAINVASSIVTSFRLDGPGWIGYEIKDSYGLPYRQPKEDVKTPLTVTIEAELKTIDERVRSIKMIIENRDQGQLFRYALRRFNRSYDEEHMEDILVDLLICFEILFVKGKEEEQKTKCLKKRVGPYLGKTGTQLQAVKDDFERAEWLRNCIVHEGKQYNVQYNHYNLTTPDSRTPWDFLMVMREYARKSLKGFIQEIMKLDTNTAATAKASACRFWTPHPRRSSNQNLPCS